MIIHKHGYTLKIINRNLVVIKGGKLGDQWHRVRTLLGKGDSNPKTAKNKITTFGLTMSPHNVAGVGTMCSMARTCKATCLAFQGQGTMSTVMASRVAKTVAFRLAPEWFREKLDRELSAKRRHNNGILGVRPNMLTDHPWENDGLPDRHPGTLFYDYSKLPNRAGWVRDNYYVTFSYDGTNMPEAMRVLESGNNVAVVFYDNSPGPKCGKAAHRQPLPSYWQGYPVIDGGVTDWRPSDPRGVVVGLRLLAKTWKSREAAIRSGFAVENVEDQTTNEDSLEYWMGVVQ
jgi:hypothetical protein